MSRRRLAAIAAIVLAAATVVLAVVVAITDFPQGVGVLGCVAVALAAAWFGVAAWWAATHDGGRGRGAGPRGRRGSADPQR